MVLKEMYAQWTYLESTGHVALRNVTKQCLGAVKSIIKWDVVCHGAVMADVHKVKMLRIKAFFPKMWSFLHCLASYLRIIRVFIVHPRNEISSPISLNQECGQLNIPTNFDQSVDMQWHLLITKSCKNQKEQSLQSFNVWNGKNSWL